MATLEVLFLQPCPQAMTRKVNPKTAGPCLATELNGKSRLQSRMRPLKDTVRTCILCTQKRLEGNERSSGPKQSIRG